MQKVNQGDIHEEENNTSSLKNDVDVEEEKDLSFQEELWQIFVNQWKALMQWMKPNPKEHFILQIIRYIYKIPVLFFVICISPIALFFLFLTFVVLL